MPVDAGPPSPAPAPSPAPMDVARAAATAARSHDDVVDLDRGLAGEFATYGLGGRVPGVRVELGPDGRTCVSLRLVVRFGRPLPDIGDEVRARVLAALADVADPEVRVHVADITDPPTPARPELDRRGAP